MILVINKTYIIYIHHYLLCKAAVETLKCISQILTKYFLFYLLHPLLFIYKVELYSWSFACYRVHREWFPCSHTVCTVDNLIILVITGIYLAPIICQQINNQKTQLWCFWTCEVISGVGNFWHVCQTWHATWFEEAKKKVLQQYNK